jgi:hypothetical protein
VLIKFHFVVMTLLGAMLVPSAAFAQTEAPVASFKVQQPGDDPGNEDAPPQTTPPAGAQQSPASDKANGPLMSFNFRFAPWEDVLKLFAETAGLTLDLNDVPPGTFNYYDKGKYTATDAMDILNGYLLPRGHVLVRRDKFLVCLNIDNGIPPNLVPKIAVEELPQRGNNELLTVVFALQATTAEQAALEVRQLMGPQGKAVALKASNSLVVTDIGSNLRLIDRLLHTDGLQPPAAVSNEIVFRAFPLKHISASEAQRLVRGLFGMSSSVPLAEAAPATGRGAAVQMTAEARTNSLLVTAPAGDLKIIEQMLQAADVDVAASGDAATADRFRNTVEVVPLGGADAARIGRALGSLSPRIRVSTTGSAEASSAVPSPPEALASDRAPPVTPPQPMPRTIHRDDPDGRRESKTPGPN